MSRISFNKNFASSAASGVATVAAAANGHDDTSGAAAAENEVAALKAELTHYHEWTQRLIDVMQSAANGDLEARILYCEKSGQLGDLGNSLNHLLDMTDAFLRESGAALEYASQGKYFRRVLLRGMRGTFRHKSELINAATQQLAADASSLKQIERLVCESSEIAVGAAREAAATSSIMGQLGAASDKIGGVVKGISQIAWQTKLLAFNATIEAARAGSAGAGFQVVAQEVKELAQQSSTAADEIAKEIATVRSEIASAGKAIETMSQTIMKMKEISSTVQQAVINQNSGKRQS